MQFLGNLLVGVGAKWLQENERSARIAALIREG